MATYAIGDLQGCFATLQVLLDKIDFNRAKDRLWFVGDLVNRGPASLECLRFVVGLGDRAITVLGNHDLHLLAVSEGLARQGKHDTLGPILEAPDRVQLLTALRHSRMLHVDGDNVMVHAGLLPQWSLGLSQQLAGEVEDALRGPGYRDLLAGMYGNEPAMWSDRLNGMDRHRITINAMTRMRVLNERNELDLKFKGEIEDLPPGFSPWFERRHASFAEKFIVAGHWSALGLRVTSHFAGLDSGCVWGRELTACRLEDRTVFQVPCAETALPKGWD
ncbi:MAG: symmetrical bis(5'-nucleosyl)-tetraphosphatase [Betaproteobacteria bacterium]